MIKESLEDDGKRKVTGMILKRRPVGEYDFVVTILTMERGKITAFARSARKPEAKLSGNVELFSYGTFTLFEGRNSYTLLESEIMNYFEFFRTDLTLVCYGTYFLELADYYSAENNDDRELLKLLYLSLTALSKEVFEKNFVRCIFELRALVIEGEFPGIPSGKKYDDAVYMAFDKIYNLPVTKLFSFKLDHKALKELIEITEMYRKRFVDKKLHSLEMLDLLVDS